VETPKVETPKVETPKVETPKVETPKVAENIERLQNAKQFRTLNNIAKALNLKIVSEEEAATIGIAKVREMYIEQVKNPKPATTPTVAVGDENYSEVFKILKDAAATKSVFTKLTPNQKIARDSASIPMLLKLNPNVMESDVVEFLQNHLESTESSNEATNRFLELVSATKSEVVENEKVSTDSLEEPNLEITDISKIPIGTFVEVKWQPEFSPSTDGWLQGKVVGFTDVEDSKGSTLQTPVIMYADGESATYGLESEDGQYIQGFELMLSSEEMFLESKAQYEEN
jgi:hypothetical protein